MVHQFEGDFIKFKMSAGDERVESPARGYFFDALVGFAANNYAFADPDLREEFSLMFQASFSSEFGVARFLAEVNRLLRQFSEQHPGLVR